MIRRFFHRLMAVWLRCRVENDQFELDQFVSREQHRINLLSTRADRHARRGARPTSPVKSQPRAAYSDFQLVRKEKEAA